MGRFIPLHVIDQGKTMGSKSTKSSRIALSQATAAENDREWARALRLYQTALRTDPKNPFLHYRIGAMFFLIGNSMDALRSLKAALQLNPNDTHTNLLILIFKIFLRVGVCSTYLNDYS